MLEQKKLFDWTEMNIMLNGIKTNISFMTKLFKKKIASNVQSIYNEKAFSLQCFYKTHLKITEILTKIVIDF
ncbi:hypothetical protein BpHYR1_003284 [Brachionus plicatilis]|uniref:Uncharacterized protein n=1 Tax=Brachionus plicatilis TaxID=10195 RepID=A0A3M7Q476_BRAPC|nr:hypothetical protein BpHYR1_003284 [Brachionus plicatilis]